MIWSFGCAKLLPNQYQARLETTPGGGNRNGDPFINIYGIDCTYNISKE